MPAKKTGQRDRCKEIVTSIYASGESVATIAHIARETGKSPQAINDMIKILADEGDVVLLSSMKGHASFIFPNNVLLPPEALVKRRRRIASMVDADDYFVLQRFCDYLLEFMRRDMTMDHVRGYIKKEYERAE